MSEYTEFFLNSKSTVVQLELLEISHPNFSKTYRIVRNNVNGVTVTLETNQTATFEYYPLRITPSSSQNNLDTSFKIDFGDLGTVIPQEFDAIRTADNFVTKPSIIYRIYRSDDLTGPILGPLIFEAETFSFTDKGASFEAKAPSLNLHKTGQIYKFDRFPSLRSFI